MLLKRNGCCKENEAGQRAPGKTHVQNSPSLVEMRVVHNPQATSGEITQASADGCKVVGSDTILRSGIKAAFV